jgi:predicted GNAT family acetyltransferase
VADVAGGQAGVFYSGLRDGGVTFTHTEVPEQAQGARVAARLARTALDWAREHDLLVKPMCPYVSACVRRHPEYHVPPDGRDGGGVLPRRRDLRSLRAIIVLVGSVALAGCDTGVEMAPSGCAEPPAGASDFFPLRTGARWLFSYTDEGNHFDRSGGSTLTWDWSGELELEVTSTSCHNGAQTYLMRETDRRIGASEVVRTYSFSESADHILTLTDFGVPAAPFHRYSFVEEPAPSLTLPVRTYCGPFHAPEQGLPDHINGGLTLALDVGPATLRSIYTSRDFNCFRTVTLTAGPS